MRSLRARWHVLVLPGPGTGRTVADREDAFVMRGLQRVTYDQLVELVGFEPGQLAHEIRRLDARRPDLEPGWNQLTICRHNTVGAHLGDTCTGNDLDPLALQFGMRGG